MWWHNHRCCRLLRNACWDTCLPQVHTHQLPKYSPWNGTSTSGHLKHNTRGTDRFRLRKACCLMLHACFSGNSTVSPHISINGRVLCCVVLLEIVIAVIEKAVVTDCCQSKGHMVVAEVQFQDWVKLLLNNRQSGTGYADRDQIPGRRLHCSGNRMPIKWITRVAY